MELTLIGKLIGGLGLFLLGMQLMTDGLKRAAGPALKQALRSATRSRLRGLLSGTLITALVQSSSAVTVATIGFVNAGLLGLGGSIAVIYGCNIGTTMTSWLVALIGFKIKIGAFALPLVGLGMLTQLLGRGKRISHIGRALAGFGIFFIGLDFLKGAFEGMEQQIPFDALGQTTTGLILYVVVGFILTFLMQSSSAAMAITLSLTAAGVMPLAAAAAMVIGTNVGTTSTAVLAAIGATSKAKRIAAAHVFFNLITAAIGIVLLMLFAEFLNNGFNNYDLDLLIILALFHTLFNLMGVALLWPFTKKLVIFLQGQFRTQEENEARPQFLDKTIIFTPTLAVEAISLELGRVSRLTTRMAREAVSADQVDKPRLQAQMHGIHQLVKHIGQYNQQLAEQDIDEAISSTLPTALRICRYFNEMARISTHLPEYYELLKSSRNSNLNHLILDYQKDTIKLLDACEIREDSYLPGSESRQLIKNLETSYQHLKSSILQTAVEGGLNASESVALLDALSHIHRLAEQSEKGTRYWSSLIPLQHRTQLRGG
ncbi:MAG: Na/Pi cotransporter family protein [Pontibacterium sp.]